MRLLLIANPAPTHVGRHFLNAARSLGWQVELLDVNAAFAGPSWVRRVCWHLLGHRPLRLGGFSRAVQAHCRVWQPDLVLATGIAPLDAHSLAAMKSSGNPVVNFLTDDPWNPAHRAPWFLRALPHYAHVFTPRRANEEELLALGGPGVSWLPFAYAPEEHRPPLAVSAEDRRSWGQRLVFIGGADADRVAAARALVRAGVPVSLWGGYWKEYPDLSAHAHGHADEEQCRRIVAAAGANLCLVRRANRDGHSMRSYELPAIGGCLLVEDTPDHRALLGTAGESAFFFSSLVDLPARAHEILHLPEAARQVMRQSARQRLLLGSHTYADRLRAIQASALPHFH
jgi:spore maturation protein CgeB